MADDDVIAVCIECHSDQDDSYIEKNIFYKQGLRVPCQFCGGNTVLTSRGSRDRALKQSDDERGI